MEDQQKEVPMDRRFIEAMLELIREKGGLKDVNLRQVSKRIGCAHTNAYNYFENFDALIFEAYDRALILYGLAVSKDLDQLKDTNQLFIQFVNNILAFAIGYPGYYRFIGADEFKIEKLPEKTIQKAIEMKRFFDELFYLVVKDVMGKKQSDKYANIVMSYIDGELYTLINRRAFPDDDIAHRVIENTKRLIELFVMGEGIPFNFDEPSPIKASVIKLGFLNEVI